MLHCCFLKPPNTKYCHFIVFLLLHRFWWGLFCRMCVFVLYTYGLVSAWWTQTLFDFTKWQQTWNDYKKPIFTAGLFIVWIGQWKPLPDWLHFCLDLLGAIPIISLFSRPIYACKKNALLFCNFCIIFFFTRWWKVQNMKCFCLFYLIAFKTSGARSSHSWWRPRGFMYSSWSTVHK